MKAHTVSGLSVYLNLFQDLFVWVPPQRPQGYVAEPAASATPAADLNELVDRGGDDPRYLFQRWNLFRRYLIIFWEVLVVQCSPDNLSNDLLA